MDRISALRNVEDAIRAFEDGEADLADTERRVATVLRTYATEFDSEDRRAYRVVDGPGEGRVVVAGTPAEAREQAVLLADAGDAVDATDVTVEPL
ncbi:DUF7854 family protein [Halobaculum gomorrense]|uniref:Uncharacterized protein n=1 Tax=Halobaculum gomorrense TaxID=43928 RepID=A0A1M5QMB5_9EURY|nr:hypothetical protein [Halobaculum gomorrense]SHH14713.1 hypothetical protein SAMN05443636_1951 [Halobaculum gomorrense]